MCIKFTTSLVIGLIVTCSSIAQEFGGNPFNTKWFFVESQAAKVIYPKGLDSIAFQVADGTEKMKFKYSGSLGKGFKKIPVVLQNQPVISNAYVGLAPWRSEFFLMPLQNALELGSTSWVDNLVTHEYRHVHQYNNFRKGISKFMYLLAGQEGQALANAMAIPDWFFEGDAVFHETQQLSQGRGRLPSFFDPYLSLWSAGKRYSFQKLRNGSFKDFVPDHYAMGYLMVAYGNEKYGNQFWGRVTNDAARYKSLVYPFQCAIQNNTGSRFKIFYGDAFKYFKSRMLNDASNSDEKKLTFENQKILQNFQFPVIVGQDSILMLRRSNNRLADWVLLTNGKMQTVGNRDVSIDDYFTFQHGKIAYTTISQDPRWSWKQYSDIRILDIQSGVSKHLTRQHRYFSPSISHNDSLVVAVQVDPQMKSALHLISMNGDVVDSIFSPNNDFLSYPCFSKDDLFLFAVLRKKDGTSTIGKCDLKTKSWDILFSYMPSPISFLRVKKNQLLFTCSDNMRNKFIAFDIEARTFNVLSSSLTSSNAGDVTDDFKYAVYSRPTAEGEQVFIKNISTSSTFSALSTPSTPSTFSNISTISSPQPYHRFSNLFNFHSWRAWFDQPEWSMSLYGQNILNTFESQLEYLHNTNEGSNKYGFQAASAMFYPWLLGGINQVYSRKLILSSNQIKWNETNIYAGAKLPLNFSSGKFYRYLNLSTQLNASQLNYDPTNDVKISNRLIQYAKQGISFAAYSQRALQHIYPHLGAAFSISNKFGFGKTSAHQFLLNSQFYLPGIAVNHSTVLSFALQQRDTLKQYYFSNSFPMARGYTAVDYPRLWKTGFNYHMPIAYSDWGFANIVYFLRIRSNLYYDMMWQKSLRTGITKSKRSAGVEFHFDTRWWNQLPVSFGFRYSRLMDSDELSSGKNRWEFIMPIDLITH